MSVLNIDGREEWNDGKTGENGECARDGNEEGEKAGMGVEERVGWEERKRDKSHREQ